MNTKENFEFDSEELPLLKESVVTKYKQQTDLLNRKQRPSGDKVFNKWVQLRELLNKIDGYMC